MKLFIFIFFFTPLAVVTGLLAGLVFWCAPIGYLAAGWMLGFSADVCFNSNYKEHDNG